MRIRFTILALLLCSLPLFADSEDKVVKFDKKAHDFGDILLSEGPVSCTFTFTNIGKDPLVVHNVYSSCGCTTPEWTKEPVKPGQQGHINAKFSNDQGPYPFDKTLTVYMSGIDRPVVLRLRGVAHENRKDLEELFEKHIGHLGLRRTLISAGYIDQGGSKSDNLEIANLSNKPVEVEPVILTEGLELNVSPNPLPARSIGKMTYSVNSAKMSTKKWGRQSFRAQLKLNGKTFSDTLSFNGLIKDNFNGWTKEQQNRSAVIEIERSYFEFGEIRKGTVKESEFVIKNKGKEPLVIHDAECQSRSTFILTQFPITVKPGAKATIAVRFDSSKLDKPGEVVNIISAITNSYSKPILNLFVTGNVIE